MCRGALPKRDLPRGGADQMHGPIQRCGVQRGGGQSAGEAPDDAVRGNVGIKGPPLCHVCRSPVPHRVRHSPAVHRDARPRGHPRRGASPAAAHPTVRPIHGSPLGNRTASERRMSTSVSSVASTRMVRARSRPLPARAIGALAASGAASATARSWCASSSRVVVVAPRSTSALVRSYCAGAWSV